MRTLFINIKTLFASEDKPLKSLRGKDLSNINTLHNAWLLCENGVISSFGLMENMGNLNAEETVDCTGKLMLPAFVDSHTHIVFAATRESEFVDKINGLTYEEIAQRGGGILNSAKRLQNTSEDQLYTDAYARALQLMKQGTGAIEIKSGYGLTVIDEIKMLRVIARLKASLPIPVKATFLGAHAFPQEFKQHHEGYIQQIISEMLPIIGAEHLADYVDVFCDKGFFSVEETAQILNAAKQYQLKPRIHGNELGITGGVQVAIAHHALSVDHLEEIGQEEIALLSNSETMATVLPGTSFFLGIPYAPARKLVDAGAALCIASDYNPGTCPNGRMSFLLSLACIKMKLLPEEALNACTINAAFALELQDEVGSISPGKRANLILTKPIDSLARIPYTFGEDMISQVFINARPI